MEADNPESSLFHSVYTLQSEVDVSPNALTGMIQSGLAVRRNYGFEFSSTDGYATCDEKLRNLFPKLFSWIDENDDDDSELSPWLIGFKTPYKKRIAVYSDDRLPTGSDIINSCHMSKAKAGIRERTLYLSKDFNLFLSTRILTCCLNSYPLPCS